MAHLESLKNSLHRFIVDPKNAPFLAVLKSARNGAVYGAKVRFPHALVMIFLFRSGSFREKVAAILRATRTHARNLALFATIYKSSMLALRSLRSIRGIEEEGKWHTFLAGLLGGYVVFGRRTKHGQISPISKQIVVFIFARVCLAAAQLLIKPSTGFIHSSRLQARISHEAWPVFAALSWASIMWLFRWHPETVQSGLRSSMDYIYVQCDSWDSLRNLLLYNK